MLSDLVADTRTLDPAWISSLTPVGLGKAQVPPGCYNASEPHLPTFSLTHLGVGRLGETEGLRGEGEVELLEGGHEGTLALGLVDEERPFFQGRCLQTQCLLQVQLCWAGEGGQNESLGVKTGLG